jgi:NTP pyrophosphatase (non-canonical NTP hydrolase)
MTTIRELQKQCGEAAAAKGFHEDRPRPFTDVEGNVTNHGLTDWQGNKLMLIVSEVAEAQDELRKGKPADQTYYPTINAMPGSFDPAFAIGKHKPEGVPSELADVVIRVLDFCYTEGIDLESIIEEKLAYNATREYKHGKKF